MDHRTTAAVLCLVVTACTSAPRMDAGQVRLATTHTPTTRATRATEPVAPLAELAGATLGAHDAPVFDAPVFDAPVFDTPVFDTPVFDAPVFDAPAPDATGRALLAAPTLDVRLEPGLLQDTGKYGPSAGESVLDLAASVSSSRDLDNDSTFTAINVGVGLGVFLTDVVEIGARTSGTFSIPDQGDNTITWFGSLDLNFNLRVSRRFWIYVGPHFGFTYIEIPGAGTTPGSSATEPSGGGQIGARIWLTPSVSLTLEERLTYSEFTFGNTKSERLDSLFRIGFTYVF